MRSAMSTYKAVVRASLVPVPGSAAFGNTAAIPSLCYRIFKAFGFPKMDQDVIFQIFFSVLWSNMGSVTLQTFSTAALFGGMAISTTGFGALLGTGIAAAGWVTAPIATGQAVLMYACDMIIVFERTLWNMAEPNPTLRIENAADWYKPYSKEVHEDIKDFFPITSPKRPFKYNKVERKMKDLISQYRYKPPA